MATTVLAVDLGAQSGRVAAIDLDTRPLEPRILHRFEQAAVTYDDGSLRWDWHHLVEEVERGIGLALAEGPVASIGVDTWGVDYGLLDANGDLLSPPYSYRDKRTDGWRDVVERIGAERLYRTTGIQLMRINTAFQLATHDRGELPRARRLLMLPELLVHALTGATMGERTSAGTTALVDITTGDWSRELLAEIGVDPAIMPKITSATAYAGSHRGVPVHLVGGHDTASAVAALPSPQPNAVFISSGTWMVVGVERDAPEISDSAMRANFSNEPGVRGNVRFLKNVMGLWMLEQCRTRWHDPPLDDLLNAAAALPSGGPTVTQWISAFSRPLRYGVRSPQRRPPPGYFRPRCGHKVHPRLPRHGSGDAIGELRQFLSAQIPEIVVVGGGARNEILNRYIEDAAGIPIREGPTETTLLGNALVQAIALGMFESLDEARSALGPLS